jgi:hypothetical protein
MMILVGSSRSVINDAPFFDDDFFVKKSSQINHYDDLVMNFEGH